jgi:hypothetical protein
MMLKNNITKNKEKKMVRTRWEKREDAKSDMVCCGTCANSCLLKNDNKLTCSGRAKAELLEDGRVRVTSTCSGQSHIYNRYWYNPATKTEEEIVEL